MFSSARPAVLGDLLVRGHVSHVVHLALLALVHGLVGLLLVSPAEAEASPESSWRSRVKRQRKEGKKGTC